MGHITVGTENSTDIELYYEDHGSGQPVVLIHGYPLDGSSWEKQTAALLGAGYRVITYDRRGFGRSSRPTTGYDYDTFAADLDALITHLDLTDVTLVGFSMGGGEVLRYLSTYGASRVRSIALLGAVPPYLFRSDDNPEGGVDDATVEGMQAGVTGDRLAFLEEFTKSFFGANGELKVSEPQRAYAVAIAAFASPKGTLDCIAAFCCTDFRDDLARATLPTLVVHGDADAIVPFEVSGKRTAELVADVELVVIADGPHGILTSHPQQVNDALVRFLAR